MRKPEVILYDPETASQVRDEARADAPRSHKNGVTVAGKLPRQSDACISGKNSADRLEMTILIDVQNEKSEA